MRERERDREREKGRKKKGGKEGKMEEGKEGKKICISLWEKINSDKKMNREERDRIFYINHKCIYKFS